MRLVRLPVVLAAAALLLAACGSTRAGFVEGSTPTPGEATTSTATPSPSPTPTGPLTITGAPFHNGEVGVGYGVVTMSATGGSPPYQWSLGSGSLPAGLALLANGTLSGTPASSGGFAVAVKVVDSMDSSATKKVSFTVYKAMTVSQTCAAQCVIGQGCSKCGGFGSVANGLSPYTYKVVGGAVPPGMSLSGFSLKGGFPAGSYSLTVQVTDKLGAHATVIANWSIYSPATLTSGGNCVDTSHYPPYCTVYWSYSGGSPSAAPKLVIVGYGQNCNALGQCATPTQPPPGWTVSVKSGTITISAAGSGCVTYYLGIVKLALVDTATCATTKQSNVVNLAVDLEYAC
jgi:hypothetical protein